MKIVKQLRQDAARLVGVGVVAGLSAAASCGVAHAADAAQPDAASTSPLSRSIFAGVTPAPTLSPQLSAEIDREIAATPTPQRAPATAATPGIAKASLVRILPGHIAAATRDAEKDAEEKDGAIAFEFPLPGHAVNSRFGLRQLSFEPHARMHDGVDIAAPKGSPIHSTADGTVVRTGLSSSYGHFVEVAHGDGLTSFYAHMCHTAGLKPGTKVTAGEVLGYVGSTGHSTGPHLHFEIRDDGKPLNPQDFMGRVFASATQLAKVEARAGEAVFSHIHHPMHMLASWRGHRRGRSAAVRYADDHRVHARFAAG